MLYGEMFPETKCWQENSLQHLVHLNRERETKKMQKGGSQCVFLKPTKRLLQPTKGERCAESLK